MTAFTRGKQKRGTHLRVCTAKLVPVKAEVEAMVAAIVLTAMQNAEADFVMI